MANKSAGNQAEWYVDVSSVNQIQERLERYGAESVQVLSNYYKTEGYKKIEENIQHLIPASGRTWKGKKPSASTANIDNVFNHIVIDGGTTLRIDTKYPAYHYLYFPDDGENTRRHIGSQHFMLRGAEAISPEIVDDVIQRLVAAFEEG